MAITKEQAKQIIDAHKRIKSQYPGLDKQGGVIFWSDLASIIHPKDPFEKGLLEGEFQKLATAADLFCDGGNIGVKRANRRRYQNIHNAIIDELNRMLGETDLDLFPMIMDQVIGFDYQKMLERAGMQQSFEGEHTR